MLLRRALLVAGACALLAPRPADARRGEFTVSRTKPKKPAKSPENPPPEPPPDEPEEAPPPVRTPVVSSQPTPPPVREPKPEFSTFRAIFGLGAGDLGFTGRLAFEGEHWFDDGRSALGLGWHAAGALASMGSAWRHTEVFLPQLAASVPIAGVRLTFTGAVGPAYVGWKRCARPLCGAPADLRSGAALAGGLGAVFSFLPGDGAVHAIVLRGERIWSGGWSATLGYAVGLGGANKAFDAP